MEKKHSQGVRFRSVIFAAVLLLIAVAGEGQETDAPTASIVSVECLPGLKVKVHIRAHCAVGIKSYGVWFTWISGGGLQVPFASPRPKDIDQFVTIEHPLDNFDRDHQIGLKVSAPNGKTALTYAMEPNGRCPGHTAMVLKLLAPNGGERWHLGTTKTITWEFVEPQSPEEPSRITIELWRGGMFEGIVSSLVPALQRSFQWTVGDLGYAKKSSPGQGYYIKIRRNKGLLKDQSDGTFDIVSFPKAQSQKKI